MNRGTPPLRGDERGRTDGRFTPRSRWPQGHDRMTLIFSEVTSRWALQVSDRLLSVSRTSGVQTFDCLSNKTVVLHARDGVASLSYTGLAYLRGIPTDTWIAQRLNGDEFPFEPDRDKFMSRTAMRRKQWPRLSLALNRLADSFTELASTPSVGLRKTPVLVAVSGWFWYRRKRPRPFIAIIAPANTGKYGVGWSPRRYGYYFLEMPLPTGYVTAHERQELDTRLGSLDLPQAAEVLAETIQTVAGRTETVGADCMAVSIPHPYSETRLITSRFIRNVHAVPSQPVTTPSFVAYSPWFIGPNQCIAPVQMIGCSLSMQLGIYTISLEGFTPPVDPETLPFSTIGPQVRKRFSGHKSRYW